MEKEHQSLTANNSIWNGRFAMPVTETGLEFALLLGHTSKCSILVHNPNSCFSIMYNIAVTLTCNIFMWEGRGRSGGSSTRLVSFKSLAMPRRRQHQKITSRSPSGAFECPQQFAEDRDPAPLRLGPAAQRCKAIWYKCEEYIFGLILHPSKQQD